MPAAARFIGVISDTHSLMREAALQALRGSEHILHAGDIGHLAVIEGLRKLCPVTAIRGNVDHGPWAEAFPETAALTLHSASIYMLHDVKQLDFDPAAADFGIVISGHSHQPGTFERDGVFYLNPGSAGPRRFRLPVTVARLRLHGQTPSVEFIEVA